MLAEEQEIDEISRLDEVGIKRKDERKKKRKDKKEKRLLKKQEENGDEENQKSNHGMERSEEEDEQDEQKQGIDGSKKKDGKKNKTKERLLKKAAEADNRGVCYLSRIPPHMDHVKLRQILSQYGEILRIYLTPSGRKSCSVQLNCCQLM